MYTYGHYCVPVTEKPLDANYVELLDIYVTDCNAHPLNIEFLYVPETNIKVPKVLSTANHIAYNVDNYDEIVAGGKAILEFICPYDDISRVAFVEYQGALIEIKETKFQ